VHARSSSLGGAARRRPENTHMLPARAVPLAKLMWQKCLISATTERADERECRRRRYADMRGQRDAGREGYSVVISRALQHHSSFMHTPVFAYIRQPVHTLLVRAGERVGWRASERAVAYFAPECMQTTQISFSLSLSCAVGQKHAWAISHSRKESVDIWAEQDM
jgi:hypothetical protein